VIASAPIVLLGLLMLAGVVDVITLHTWRLRDKLRRHGLTYTFFAAEQVPLAPWGVILAPLFALPQCWLWGLAGGMVGRRMPRRRQSAIAD